jgi:hypothetical protein
VSGGGRAGFWRRTSGPLSASASQDGGESTDDSLPAFSFQFLFREPATDTSMG